MKFKSCKKDTQKAKTINDGLIPKTWSAKIF